MLTDLMGFLLPGYERKRGRRREEKVKTESTQRGAEDLRAGGSQDSSSFPTSPTDKYDRRN
jgi:hypothetical protein